MSNSIKRRIIFFYHLRGMALIGQANRKGKINNTFGQQ